MVPKLPAVKFERSTKTTVCQVRTEKRMQIEEMNISFLAFLESTRQIYKSLCGSPS